MKNEIVTGNYYDKHASRNPVEMYLLFRYKVALLKLFNKLSVKRCYEVGSGEGYILQLLEDNYSLELLIGSDIDFNLMLESKKCKESQNRIVNEAEFVPFAKDQLDLILVCEVLEHLKNPKLFLSECYRLNAKYYLFTVPNEPLWRILNIFRLKYLKDFGNTTGHLNHWTKHQFIKLISSFLDVIEVFYSQPWIFLLAKPK
jgi:2-polyprenyl-3-methyl-5-hydroxy-6-metoxy-1,4-benzoquinol methylase